MFTPPFRAGGFSCDQWIAEKPEWNHLGSASITSFPSGFLLAGIFTRKRAFSGLSALPSETGNHATFLQGKGSRPGTVIVRPNRESSQPEIASLDRTLYGFMNAMPDEPEIDFEKLQAGDEGQWERAYPALYQAGFKVASGYRAKMGEVDEDDFIIQAVEKAHAQITKKASFKHLCNFVATATKNAIRDELDKRKRVRHGGGKVESLDALRDGVIAEGSQDSSSGDEQHSREVAIENRIVPDEATHIRMLAELHKRALGKIERRYSNVLEDRWLKELDYKEIAKKRGLSIDSVGVYLREGLNAMLEFVPERDKTAWWHKDERDPP